MWTKKNNASEKVQLRDIDQDMTAVERVMEEKRELRELVDEMNGQLVSMDHNKAVQEHEGHL